MSQEKPVLGPTLTMARLYESQQQFLDALAIYRKLHEARGDAEAAEKIAELEQKILSERSLSYDAIISQAFSREELKRFRVLPAEKYRAWRQAMVDNGPQSAATGDEPLDDTPGGLAGTITLGDEPEQHSETITLDDEPESTRESIEIGGPEDFDPKWEAVAAPEAPLGKAEGVTLGQVITRLRALGDDDTPIDRIPLGKLLDALRGGRS